MLTFGLDLDNYVEVFLKGGFGKTSDKSSTGNKASLRFEASDTLVKVAIDGNWCPPEAEIVYIDVATCVAFHRFDGIPKVENVTRSCKEDREDIIVLIIILELGNDIAAQSQVSLS